MIRMFLLLIALSAPAAAKPARVLSGEHGDFTRLVIEMPDGEGWTLGHTAKGYAFAATSGTALSYDIADVWQRIPRTRLQSLGTDPDTGALSISLGCDCHVFPFEYAPGIVVLDIKEGPAPAGSAFEAAFATPGTLKESTTNSANYDWLDHRDSAVPKVPRTLPFPIGTGTVSLQPLRDQLLEQIARGAADGLVDMDLSGSGETGVDANGDLPWAHLRVGEDPGVIVTTPGALVQDPQGDEDCAPPDLLDLASWGDGQLPQDLLASSRDGIFGEFDAPDEAAILKATRQLLYLGFGAEAGQTIDLLSDSTRQEVAFYRSMSRLVDGESDPGTPFADMIGCDGPAALWAALAMQRLSAGPSVNRDAVLQGYQALPAHLRQSLGPALAEKFLARDDGEAARIIRDAMQRSPDADPASVALLDAQTNLHDGNAEAAQANAQSAVALDGNRAESLIALVEAHFADLTPLGPETADALLGLRGETDATDLGEDLQRAIVLSLALSNRIDEAFDEAPSPSVTADLWEIVEARTEDDTFLRHAVLPRGATRPDVHAGTATRIADRLLALGFPDAAATWLGTVDLSDAADRRLTAANAALGRGDAAAAVALLTGIEDPEAQRAKARALLQIGDLPSAGTAFTAIGDLDAANRTRLWNGDWMDLDPAAPEVWRLAADQAKPADGPADLGLLGRGGRSIDASLASREAIEALLATVPSPANN
jgi:hypothetical protein